MGPVVETFMDHHGSFGRRHLKKLLAKKGYHLSEWKISNILKIKGLESKYGRKKIKNVYTSPTTEKYIKENLYSQLSQEEKEKEIWSTDFTEIKVEGKPYYICGIISIQSKVLVGYAKSSKNNTTIALEALESAIKQFGPPYMILTDRGSPFVSKKYHSYLEENNIIHSMSRPYKSVDNIFIETFWKTMKREIGNLRSFQKAEVDKMYDYYFNYYNNFRPHSSIGYNSPMEEWIKRH